jgi:Cu-Zn family superoxide dismutase
MTPRLSALPAIPFALLIALAAPALAQQTAEATFLDTQGREIGTAALQQVADGVLIRIDIANLPPGEHAFHIHDKGKCEPQSGFKSAGEHHSPEKKPHGFHGKLGHHAGDMPNQFVSQDGRLQAEVLNPHVQLSVTSLLDPDGSALVIHAAPDDYRTQPSGNAGERIACAEIRPAKVRASNSPRERVARVE